MEDVHSSPDHLRQTLESRIVDLAESLQAFLVHQLVPLQCNWLKTNLVIAVMSSTNCPPGKYHRRSILGNSDGYNSL